MRLLIMKPGSEQRYHKVAKWILLLLAAATCLPAQVRTADATKRGLKESDFPRTIKVSANVYTYEDFHSGADRFTTTNLFVVTSEGVLVADAQGDRAATQGLINAIAKVTSQPIRYVVVCSEHPDHTGGNAAFPASVTWVTHPATKAALEQQGGWKPPANAVLVADEKTITMGGEEFRIRFLGRAHTAGPLAVYLPGQKIAFLSETFCNHLFPQMRTGYPGEWPRTLATAEAIDARVFIPGHGFTENAVVSVEELRAFHKAVQAAVDEGTRLYKAGVPVEDAVKQADWGEYAAWTGGGSPSPRIQDMGPTAVRRIYLELSGRLN
jgi:glyoxylase-like metal-dependent hydrolase (beta-lactamase superfamily II)